MIQAPSAIGATLSLLINQLSAKSGLAHPDPPEKVPKREIERHIGTGESVDFAINRPARTLYSFLLRWTFLLVTRQEILAILPLHWLCDRNDLAKLQ